MTTTASESRTIQQVATANAEWVAEHLDRGDVESLLFLKYRPLREVEDVLDAAKRARLEDVVSVMTDAVGLARGHTGGPSRCPTGYEAITYPVTPEERAELMGAAGDAVRLLRLPGADRGFTWSQSVDLDTDTMTVTVTLVARHPTMADGSPAAT